MANLLPIDRQMTFLVNTTQQLVLNSLKPSWSQASSQESRLSQLTSFSSVTHVLNDSLSYFQSSRRGILSEESFRKVCLIGSRISTSFTHMSLLFGTCCKFSSEVPYETANASYTTAFLLVVTGQPFSFFFLFKNGLGISPYQSTYPGERSKEVIYMRVIPALPGPEAIL
jgi:hypothetical protein